MSIIAVIIAILMYVGVVWFVYDGIKQDFFDKWFCFGIAFLLFSLAWVFPVSTSNHDVKFDTYTTPYCVVYAVPGTDTKIIAESLDIVKNPSQFKMVITKAYNLFGFRSAWFYDVIKR